MPANTKIYRFWNGKNVDGKSYAGSAGLLSEDERKGQTEMKYEVGCDTISADDLQPGTHYE